MAVGTGVTVAATVGGIGLVCAGLLYALRRKMTRKWIDLAKSFPELQDVRRLEGQVVVVTGGNTGLGRVAAQELAKRGPRVLILACRNVVAGNEAARAIAASTGHPDVRCMLLDLACLESVRKFVADLEGMSVDTLVCNAGVWMPMEKKAKTADGFEIHAGVNHLAHFLLVNLLIRRDNDVIVDEGAAGDVIRSTSGLSRVVVVSSGLAASGIVDLDDLEVFYDGRQPDPETGSKRRGRNFAPTGYCDSKLMNVMFCKELVKRYPAISGYSVCPGWCKTDLARNVNIPVYKKVLMLPVVLMFMRSAFQGAQNILFAALQDPEKMAANGGFYRDGQLVPKEDDKVNAKQEDNAKLWDISSQLVNLQDQ